MSYKPFSQLVSKEVPERRKVVSTRMGVVAKQMLQHGWRGGDAKYEELKQEFEHLTLEHRKTFKNEAEYVTRSAYIRTSGSPIWNGSYTEWLGWGFPGNGFNWNNNEERPYGIY